MARYQLILAYDGTNFFGFQRQGSKRTVQSVLEKALGTLGWRGKTLLAAGRTDSGVHASGQVVSFDLEWLHPKDALLKALNARLPNDVAVHQIEQVEDGFHPRYDADWRQYEYTIFCQTDRDPLRERYIWRVWPEVNYERLNLAADQITGSHDFSAFGRPMRKGSSTIREVLSARWMQDNNQLCFQVKANAFLYHMVRRLVFIQVLVGQGKVSLEDLVGGVQQCKPQTSGIAPAHGLCLVEVGYTSDRQGIRALDSA
jgi:tRNA pseudouridine38-40 synthase